MMDAKRRRLVQSIGLIFSPVFLTTCGGGGGGGSGSDPAPPSSSGASTNTGTSAAPTTSQLPLIFVESYDRFSIQNNGFDTATSTFIFQYSDTTLIPVPLQIIDKTKLTFLSPGVTSRQSGEFRIFNQKGDLTHRLAMVLTPIPMEGKPGVLATAFLKATISNLDATIILARDANDADLYSGLLEQRATLTETLALVTKIMSAGKVDIGTDSAGTLVSLGADHLSQIDQMVEALNLDFARITNAPTQAAHMTVVDRPPKYLSLLAVAANDLPPKYLSSFGSSNVISLIDGRDSIPPVTPVTQAAPNPSVMQANQEGRTFETMTKVLSFSDNAAGWLTLAASVAATAALAFTVATVGLPLFGIAATGIAATTAITGTTASVLATTALIANFGAIAAKFAYGKPSGYTVTENAAAALSVAAGKLFGPVAEKWKTSASEAARKILFFSNSKDSQAVKDAAAETAKWASKYAFKTTLVKAGIPDTSASSLPLTTMEFSATGASVPVTTGGSGGMPPPTSGGGGGCIPNLEQNCNCMCAK